MGIFQKVGRRDTSWLDNARPLLFAFLATFSPCAILIGVLTFTGKLGKPPQAALEDVITGLGMIFGVPIIFAMIGGTFFYAWGQLFGRDFKMSGGQPNPTSGKKVIVQSEQAINKRSIRSSASLWRRTILYLIIPFLLVMLCLSLWQTQLTRHGAGTAEGIPAGQVTLFPVWVSLGALVFSLALLGGLHGFMGRIDHGGSRQQNDEPDDRDAAMPTPDRTGSKR